MTRYRRSALRAAPKVGRFACTPFMRDIGIALSLKFVLLGLLYYAFFDNGNDRQTHPNDAVVAQAFLGAPAPLSEVRRGR